MRIWFRETEQALGRRAPLNMDFDTMRAKTGEQEGIICTDERMNWDGFIRDDWRKRLTD